MNDKHKIFISSVQSEFSRERKALARYIREDALLGDFFEVFLFEEQPAENRSAQSVYLDEVAMCDVYLGLFGSKYGSRDKNGISPTEREYDRATELHKTRLAFVKTSACREKKEETFIRGKIDTEGTQSRHPVGTQSRHPVGTQSRHPVGTQLIAEPKGLFRSVSYRFVMFRAQRKSCWTRSAVVTERSLRDSCCEF